MTKTVKTHQEEADAIRKHIADADALVSKLQRELIICRGAIEWAKGFSHPEFRRDARFKDFNPLKDGDPATLKEVADARIASINAILGDRA